MFKSIAYVIKENINNLYRIFCIAKYELLADMRDSRFGLFWNFASPTIQVFTYWLVFGIGMNRKGYDGVSYLPWAIVGFSVWWFIQPCITNGCSAVFSKINVITKMKFPVSILPATVVLKEFFNHLFMMIIAFVVVIAFGFYPNLYWLGIIYYAFCTFMFAEALALITSVLTMLWRDVKKFVVSMMRMLLYLSPILWPAAFSKKNWTFMTYILKLNPIYYLVTGYRDSLLFGKPITAHPVMALYFWCLVIILFAVGSVLMYRFKRKMIDMI